MHIHPNRALRDEVILIVRGNYNLPTSRIERDNISSASRLTVCYLNSVHGRFTIGIFGKITETLQCGNAFGKPKV